MSNLTPRGLEDTTGFSSNVESSGNRYVKEDGTNVIPNLRFVSLYKSGTQAMAGSETITVTFDEELADTDDFHDNSVNNERIVIPAQFDGYIVEVIAHVKLTTSLKNGIEAWIEHYNSSNALLGTVAISSSKSTGSDPLSISVISPPTIVSNGDYFIFKLENIGVGSQPVMGGFSAGTFFVMIVKNT